MNERMQKAFDVAQDTIKQLITIATAIVGAIVTFSGSGNTVILNFKAAGAAVPTAIIILLISIGSGLAALMNLVGTLANTDIQHPTPYRPGICIFVIMQITAFASGVIVLGVFAPQWNWSALMFWSS